MTRRRARRQRRAQCRVLVLVQNLPFAVDRRVQNECRALRDAGYGVSVICPRGDGDRWFEVRDGIRVRHYPPPPAAEGFFGFAWEFAYSWLATAAASFVTLVRDGVDVIHACNPPDTLFVLGMLLRPFGVRFVFDQHDLCPEVYDARFPTGSGFARRGLLALERGSYRLADQVIVTNESYKQVALTRGGIDPSKVTVVRSGPDPARFRRGDRNPGHANGRHYVCCYLGVMGPQDGVDLALHAIDVFVHDMRRTDTQFVFIGAGDCYDELRALAREFALDEFVDFTGRLPANDPELLSVLSSADIGLCPDPFNALNDASTMNKTLEYMAFELPVVAFDLHETRVSAGESAVYVTPNDVGEYARALGDLLDDPDRRRSMGTSGRRRVEGELSWQHQVPALLSVYSRVAPLASPSTGTA